MTYRFHIDAQADYVLRIAHRDDPVRAVVELIWNSLDAEATRVSVTVEPDGLDGVARVTVADNGHGVPPEEVATRFGQLGGSWKRTAKRSPNIKRQMNGRGGQGRIRGFALGDYIKWTTTAVDTPGELKRTIIKGTSADPTNFERETEPTINGDAPGTAFEATNPPKFITRLSADDARSRLTAIFSVFLTENPTVAIEFRGRDLDPAAAERHRVEVVLGEAKDGHGLAPVLRIIEWHEPADRVIHLCDTSGSIRTTVHPDIQTPGLNYTAFVIWDYFDELSDEDLAAGELAGEVSDVLTLARQEIKNYFKGRDEQRRAEQVAEWKQDGDYPYGQDPLDEIERVERETFDFVATTIARKLPKQKMGRRSTLALLKTTISSQPSEAVKVLEQVMNLPKGEIKQLSDLLDRTQISQLIAANTKLTNRLDFLKVLKEIAFDPEARKTTKERTQLHKLLEKNTWVFGEEYDLMASDRSLDAVLDRHLGKVRDKADLPLTPVRRSDDSVGIVDLMLGQARPAVNRTDYLVVELKRPSVPIGAKEVNQIKSYADAVTADAQFQGRRSHWDFLLISTKIDRVTKKDISDNPLGLLSDWTDQDPPARIWVKTWAEIIDERESQLRFFKDALNYDASREHAIDYVNRNFPENAVPEKLRVVSE
ncbi:ATP-binding protein [Rhodococcus sp. 06-412-2C]|uniref:ATP-binding protein n=1 Tax=unclassified Rhodococcus (in: high G+C Gram-positive bacteria) TaxID=192944 RepID=UPI000B9AFC49|nr:MULTISPECIES: ATP-binding protein [unclassified Rhodococcus (in: high G+C Gram-positive bacteria)]OZC91749.1 ATP-binding protein [Rhodococcus sp. 06-412-2C]OZC92317.1 ATP-binding protein [Rhodococcus sp. 06-412-2B]